ncbi:MAG: gluconolactonase [Gemmataceae bacterium]|nr:gluconolactonase [Gemmataceae bacterium]
MAAIPSTEARVYVVQPDEEGRFLPEGPRAVDLDGDDFLVWVNIQTAPDARTGTIWGQATGPDLDRFHIPAPGRPGFALPVAGGNRVLVGLDKELRVCDLDEVTWSDPIARIPDTDPRTIINDAEVVPGGKAVVFGTKDTRFAAPIAQLYLYTVDDNRVSVLADGQTCSNGKVFAAEGHELILYDIDTPTRTIVRYRLDVAARTAIHQGVAIDLTQWPGFPDGMRSCGDGTAIVAFYNPEPVPAGKAVRFDLATGRAVEEWTTPGSPRVTCPCLIRQAGGVKLILTTATEGMPADQRAKCPNAGNLFIADTSLSACPPPEGVRLSG